MWWTFVSVGSIQKSADVPLVILKPIELSAAVIPVAADVAFTTM